MICHIQESSLSNTLIIAEAGVNHNGDIDLAYRLIDAAKSCGADVVKFQTFKAKDLVTDNAQQADYQQRNLGSKCSQLEMLAKLELSFEQHKLLSDYCEKVGIEYLSTAFDDESLDFLIEQTAIKRLKVPSGELTNSPFLLKHARSRLPLIISTGMANLAEIEQALNIVAFGLLTPSSKVVPSQDELTNLWQSKEAHLLLSQNVTLLHCTSDYPAPLKDIHLNALTLFQEKFGLSVGYSDHTVGHLVPCLAIAKDARVIEKHFTLDKALPGPDHKASLSINELQQMIVELRQTEVILGLKQKQPSAKELATAKLVRKSLVAKRDIKQGEKFTDENLCIKRPGNGLHPETYWRLIDTVCKANYSEGDLIDPLELV